MSIVHILDHNESVRNLIELRQHEDSVPPRYISRFYSQVRKEAVKGKEGHRTFGYAQIHLDKPSEFLKKHKPIVPPRPKTDEPKRQITVQKPQIPHLAIKQEDNKKVKFDLKGGVWDQDWKTGKGVRCPCKRAESEKEEKYTKVSKDDIEVLHPPRVPQKNYQMQNILQVIRSVPRKPVKKYADTKCGALHDLEPSGIFPKYVHKKGYGEMPLYLARWAHQSKEKSMDTKPIETVEHMKLVAKYMGSNEREELLKGMRHNWTQLQKSHQLLPLQIDTIPQIRYKERLEKQLKQLENDIRIVERHPYMYILNDESEND